MRNGGNDIRIMKYFSELEQGIEEFKEKILTNSDGIETHSFMIIWSKILFNKLFGFFLWILLFLYYFSR